MKILDSSQGFKFDSKWNFFIFFCKFFFDYKIRQKAHSAVIY